MYSNSHKNLLMWYSITTLISFTGENPIAGSLSGRKKKIMIFLIPNEQPFWESTVLRNLWTLDLRHVEGVSTYVKTKKINNSQLHG